jgi:GT2 family glycosyltransferase
MTAAIESDHAGPPHATPIPTGAAIGLVAIGRNEGERLRACLATAHALVDAGAIGAIIYVDSGSTDDSIAIAECLGVQVVHLSTAAGFTAGKARNAGAAALANADAPPALIQFVDGDCVIDLGWLDAARAALALDPARAVVAGRRRERFPDASIWNRLCDMEWNTPYGLVDAVGGDALYRADAFHGAGGFDPSFICGEEPELNYRLRQNGWTIQRIGAEMTLHDAAMTRWTQWWKRSERAGWAFAEGAATYGDGPEAYNRREARRIWIWGAIWPVITLAALILGIMVPAALPIFALGLLVLPVMSVRIARRRGTDFGDPWRHALLYGLFMMLGKPAEALGAARFWLARARGLEGRIIEYKGAAPKDITP